MTVLSLFDGMSCLQIALRELNIRVDTYYASEIDKHAIRNTQHNFPNTKQLGNITKWREWDIDWSSIDFIGAGSPCQGFSLIGKQLAFDDPRSKLFWVFVEILNRVRTLNSNIKFLLENVVMKRKYLQVITGALGIQPVLIDSARVSAQHRERYYWSNIRTKYDGLQTDIPQPENRGLVLADILDNEVDEKYFIDKKRLKYILNPIRLGKFVHIDGKKSATLCATDEKTWNGQYISENKGIRKLTPSEYSKLQGIPNWYEWVVPNTQIYSICGNGWNIPTITHILSFL